MKSTIWSIAIIESILVLVFCLYSTWNYAAKGRTPIYVYLFTIIGWFLGLMILFLIPLDIYTVSYIIISYYYRLKRILK